MARNDAGETAPALTGRFETGSIDKLLSRRLSVSIGLILAAALVLRLVAARGELWLDEIWSLTLVAPLRSAGEVFWGISHDNNHVLNSLWLYEAGPGRSALVYRLPAVLFGTLSVLAAARLGLRRDGATAIAMALLTTFSLMLVNYGSEARGYAGLTLAILIAIDAFEEALAARLAPVARRDRTGVNRQRWILAVAIGFGTLSHLTMLATVAALGLTAVIRLGQAARSRRALVADLTWLFAPSALLVLPAIVCLVAGCVVQGGFTVGGAAPFVFEQFLAGYGDLLRFSSGLPRILPFWMVFGLVGAGLLLAWTTRLVDPARGPLIIVSLAVLPGLMLAGRLPNLEYPRYFLTSGLVLVICQADVIGHLWRRGGRWRWAGAGLMALILAGQLSPLSSLLRDGRGSYTAALDEMRRDGGTTYASNRSFATRMVVTSVDDASTPSLAPIADRSFCAIRPDWFIDSIADEIEPPSRIAIGPGECKISYGRRGIYRTSPLSGLQWTLYRRQDD